MTPLFCTTYNGHEAMLRLFIEHGASIHRKDTYRECSLSWAAQKGHAGVVKLLIEKGMASDNRDVDGRTPLSRAAGKGYVVVTILLLENGAVADSLDVFNRSTLSWASCNGNTTIARLLLQAGVKIDSQAGNRRWAAEKGHMGVVEMLIDFKADIDRQDDDGLSPLAWAARYGYYVEVMKLLRQRGTRSDNSNLDYSHTQCSSTTNTGDQLSPIQFINFPTQSSPSRTSSVTVERNASKREEGQRNTHRPAGVTQELSSDQETMDSEDTKIPNANDAYLENKRRHSFSQGYNPAAKNWRFEW